MKTPALVAAAAVSAALLAPLPAAAQDQAELIRPIEGPLTFVFIPKVIHPWYDVVADGAQHAVEEFERLGIEINVIWDQPPQADVADQNRRIEVNIGRQPDGLAVACLDQATNVQMLGEAKAAGINVITFNSFCSDAFPFVGQDDSHSDGYALGRYLAEAIGGEGKVGILSGSLTATDHVERIIGFKEALADYPDMEIVFEQPDNDVLEQAVTLTENALQAHPDLAGLFGSNASNPIGAARAVQNAGKAGEVMIVGMDDLPEAVDFLCEGVIEALRVQRQWDIGYWAVRYMVAMNQNHTIPMDHNTGSRTLSADDCEA
jgi:ribose transport system substrate-binding protein